MEQMYEAIPFSPRTELTVDIGETDTVIQVNNIAVFPDGPCLATIGTDENAETIRYSTKTNNALSGCERGIEGTARAWNAGDVIARNFTAKDADAMRKNIEEHANASGNVHNLSKEDINLGNVDNTADTDKPVSTDQAEAIADAKKAGTDAQTSIASHVANTNNPHGVTKAQVGLGNVPNVATNDQTPTYTAASTLAALVSGEKLSVAFGKITKAISDFIRHLANKSNPHEVTAEQVGARPSTWTPSASDVGLGNVDNTADADKPVSTAQAEAIADAKKAGTDAQTSIASHVANTNNPHGVTATQLGLGGAATDIANLKSSMTNLQNVVSEKTEKTLIEVILDNAWTSQSDGSFTKTITVAEVVSGCDIIADCNITGSDVDANTAILEAWSCINRIDDSNAGYLTFYCYSDAPAVSIPVSLLIFT